LSEPFRNGRIPWFEVSRSPQLSQAGSMQIRRFENNPIIRPDLDERIGSNINGPSLIRVPDWLPRALGRYYLYFADHGGKFIRLAYADRLEGPWTVHSPGTLTLEQTQFPHHIASPDVHVDHERRQIRMYYHGCCVQGPWGQATCAALSDDGLRFEDRPEMLGSSYWRVFQYDGWHYALVMPGEFRRSRDPLSGFESGPTLFTEDMRHAAVLLRGSTLHIWFSNAKDCPERILWSTVDLRGDWLSWQASEPVTVLTSETEWEGVNEPLEPSRRGSARGPVRQLRDPCIYSEDERVYLLYAVAGESGIAIAEITGV